MTAAGASGGVGTATATTTSRFETNVKSAETARVSRPLPLMPGAEGDAPAPESREDAEAGTAPTQLTIVYGGRVLVLDDVPADKAAGLLQAAAASAAAAAWGANKTVGPIAAADLPVARKVSLQRFMENRKGRAAARAAPYLRPGTARGDRGGYDLTLAL
jgi:jasmonate ZIM domain-containing protein